MSYSNQNTVAQDSEFVKSFFNNFDPKIVTNSQPHLALFYQQLGKPVLLPVPLGSKGEKKNGVTMLPGWQQKTFEETQSIEYQKLLAQRILAGGNISVLLGPASGGIATLDIDKPEDYPLYLALYPELATCMVTKARGYKFWFKPLWDYPKRRVILKSEDGKPTVEFRGGGGLHCVLWGVHPDPEIGRFLLLTRLLMQGIQSEGLQKEINEALAAQTPHPSSGVPGWNGPEPDEDFDTSQNNGQESGQAGQHAWTQTENLRDAEFRELDLVGALRKLGVALTRTKEGDKYWMRCPWCETHQHPTKLEDTFIRVQAGQWPIFNCSHTSCNGRKLKDLLEWMELKETGIVARYSKSLLSPILLPTSNKYISKFGAELGVILRPHYFTQNGRMVRLKDNDERHVQEIASMEVNMFRTAIERYCQPFIYDKRQKKKVHRTMSMDIASATLACEDMLDKLRPIAALNHIRLPVLRPSGVIELLPEGYDEESGVMTLTTKKAEYAQDWTPEKAKAYLLDLLSEFPYTEDDKEHSITVSVASMLTLFCRHILPPDIERPNFLWDANRPGAGKTLGVKLAIIPILGYCPAGTLPPDESEIRKTITTVIRSGAPVLFFDNVKSHINSSGIESLTTSSDYRDRILGTNTEVNRSHGVTVFVTGNGCTFSDDFRRRTFMVSLFLPKGVTEDRFIRNPLNKEKILEIRPEILASQYGLLQHWYKAGMPKPLRSHDTFIRWSEVINGILEYNGFMRLQETQAKPRVGDELVQAKIIEEPAWQQQTQHDLEKLIMAMKPGFFYRMENLSQIIEKNHLFEGMSKQGRTKTVGVLLGKWKGRIIGSRKLTIIDNNNRGRKDYLVTEVQPAK